MPTVTDIQNDVAAASAALATLASDPPLLASAQAALSQARQAQSAHQADFDAAYSQLVRDLVALFGPLPDGAAAPPPAGPPPAMLGSAGNPALAFAVPALAGPWIRALADEFAQLLLPALKAAGQQLLTQVLAGQGKIVTQIHGPGDVPPPRV